MSDTNKIKLFNKTYKEMQNGINKSLKKGNSKVYSIKKIDDITMFVTQLEENIELYNLQDAHFFDNVCILKRVFFGKPALSSTNKIIVWKFIQNLYSIGEGVDKTKKIVPIGEGGLEDLIKGFMGDKDSGFKDLMGDISAQIEKATEGKQLDEQQLISDLMKGNLNSSGIDFQSIIEGASKNLQNKVNSGEIDIENIKKMGEKIQNIRK